MAAVSLAMPAKLWDWGVEAHSYTWYLGWPGHFSAAGNPHCSVHSAWMLKSVKVLFNILQPVDKVFARCRLHLSWI